MSSNNNHSLGKVPWFHVIISTGLGSGFFPGAPGTFAGFIALIKESLILDPIHSVFGRYPQYT